MLRALLTLAFVTFATAGLADPAATARAMAADVIFLRHALAPGTGDPGNFRLDDCQTQRNLSQDGRAQAQAIGAALRAAGLPIVQVMTSQWCRARDTAVLLGLGPVTEEPGLNSFFGNAAARDPVIARLRQVLASLPEGVTVMVTHQVVITAITGQTAPSGGAVLFNSRTGRAAPLPLR